MLVIFLSQHFLNAKKIRLLVRINHLCLNCETVWINKNNSTWTDIKNNHSIDMTFLFVSFSYGNVFAKKRKKQIKAISIDFIYVSFFLVRISSLCIVYSLMLSFSLNSKKSIEMTLICNICVNNTSCFCFLSFFLFCFWFCSLKA